MSARSINLTTAAQTAGPRTGDAPAPASLLDDWENWPRNDDNLDPSFDDLWPLSDEFCECGHLEQCSYCSDTREVFHVAEFTAGRESVPDRKINTQELHQYLKQLETLAKSDAETAIHPSVRMFFACGNLADGGLRFAYMRHFLAYCRIPPHFFHVLSDSSCIPVFQAAYERAGASNVLSTRQSGILHIYLQTFSYMRTAHILVHSELYYSSEFAPAVQKWVQGGGFSPLCPSLYLRYDEASQESIVYVADSTSTFHSLRNIFKKDVRGANQNPFLLVAIFLQHRVTELHKYVDGKRRSMREAIGQTYELTSLDTESSALFAQFGYLADEGPSNARMRHEASGMLRALKVIEDQHQRFLARHGNADTHLAEMIGSRFQQQHAELLELESALAALVTGIEIVKDLMAGRAQILNGIDMAKMAKDNQTQAAATERFAEDARNDSKIMKRDSATMKTITVVTLVYLPATFVSTLLSMGIFDFGVDGGEQRSIRIAREGWLFIAISLPLTILTLVLSYLWKQAKEKQWKQEEDAAAAKLQLEKSAASGDGKETPHETAPEPAASEDAAQPSRRKRWLATLQGLRRRRAPQMDSEKGNPVDADEEDHESVEQLEGGSVTSKK